MGIVSTMSCLKLVENGIEKTDAKIHSKHQTAQLKLHKTSKYENV